MRGQSQGSRQYLLIFLLEQKFGVHILYSESVLGRTRQASYRRYLGFQDRQMYQTVRSGEPRRKLYRNLMQLLLHNRGLIEAGW